MFCPALQCTPQPITISPIVLLYRSSQILFTRIPVIRDPSYSECLPECPPRVWYSPAIHPSKFALHNLSDTPVGVQKLQYILLMKASPTPTKTTQTVYKSHSRDTVNCYLPVRVLHPSSGSKLSVGCTKIEQEFGSIIDRIQRFEESLMLSQQGGTVI